MQEKNLRSSINFLFIISVFIAFLPVARAQFQDVSSSHPHYDAIVSLEKQGVIKGFQDGTFRPEIPVKRAELLKMLFTHIGYKPFDKLYDNTFKDVPGNSWFAPYVHKGLELGVLTFNSQIPFFFPDQPITKIEALKIIMPLEGIPVPFINDNTPLIFEDVQTDAPYAYLVKAAQNAGIYFMNSNKFFNTFKNLTRAETAGLLYRAQMYREARGQVTNFPGIEDINTGASLNSTELKLINDPKFPLFLDIWTKINEEYVNKENIEQDDLLYGALEGMVEKLNDPYSLFTSPQKAAEIEDALEGNYEGIGTIIDVFENNFIIVKVLKDSPAEKTGLKPGDIIKKVDDKSIIGLSTEDLINLIKGPAGTKVTITVNRDGQTLNFTITRENLSLETVIFEQDKSPVTIPSDISYITIYQFTNSTDEEFATILEDTLSKKPKGIILDLRNNPGGYLDASYNVLNHIIPEDHIMVYIKTAERLSPYESKGPGELNKLPLIVLVNDNTASSAEVVAGAIQDHKVGKLIGEKTFGKGTVQEITTYTDGSLFKLSIAHWLTPLKRDINGIGLTPDIVVTPTKDDALGKTDSQLQKAITELQKEF